MVGKQENTHSDGFALVSSKPPGAEGDVLTFSPLPSSPSSLLRFVYETEHFNGVAELLEILGR